MCFRYNFVESHVKPPNESVIYLSITDPVSVIYSCINIGNNIPSSNSTSMLRQYLTIFNNYLKFNQNTGVCFVLGYILSEM